MDANKTIELAQENLKKFRNSGLKKLSRTHAYDVEIATIGSLLEDLEKGLLWLKARTANFNISVSISEVTDFDKALNNIITQCASLSQHPNSLERGYVSDELNKMERSLLDQVGILQGKKPSPPPRSDVLGNVASIGLNLTDPIPGETNSKATVRGWLRIGAEMFHGVVNASKPEAPKLAAKEMVGRLCSLVETQIEVCGNRSVRTTLNHVKSRLDVLRKENLIDYVDDIEREIWELHFCINEVEDLKKELSFGMSVCSVVISEVYNTTKLLDDLHKLDKALQKQGGILKSKVVVYEHGLVRLLPGHHKH